MQTCTMGNCVNKEAKPTVQKKDGGDSTSVLKIDVEDHTSDIRHGVLVGIVVTESNVWVLRSDASGMPSGKSIMVYDMSDEGIKRKQRTNITEKKVKMAGESHLFMYEKFLTLPGASARTIMWCEANFWYGYGSSYDLDTFCNTPEFISTLLEGERCVNSAQCYKIPRRGLTLQFIQQGVNIGTVRTKPDPLEVVYIGDRESDVLVRNTSSSYNSMPDGFVTYLLNNSPYASRFKTEAGSVFLLAEMENRNNMMRCMAAAGRNVRIQHWDIISKSLQFYELVNMHLSIYNVDDQTMQCSDGRELIMLTHHVSV